MEAADYCMHALREPVARWGVPGDRQHRPGQPVQQRGLVAEVQRIGARQSMDGKGC